MAAAKKPPSSVCDSAAGTASDLSVIANPLAYAERVRTRLEAHIGGGGDGGGDNDSGSGSGGVTVAAASQQLDSYLKGHDALNQRAAALQKLARRRREQQEQQQQHTRDECAAARARPAPPAPPAPLVRMASVSLSRAGSSSVSDGPPLTPVSQANRLLAKLKRHVPPSTTFAAAPQQRGAADNESPVLQTPDDGVPDSEARRLFLFELQGELERSLQQPKRFGDVV
jgi:hypothetical protein